MFKLPSIWKKRGKGLLSAAALSVFASVALAGPALAAGELYNWTDANNTTVTATGGNFTGTVTFNKTGTPNGGATYTATNAAYLCPSPSGTSTTGNLTLTVDAADLQATPSQATLGGAAANCDFDPVVIGAPSGTDATTGQSTAVPADETDTCDQGSLSWLLCPVMDNISTGVANLAKDVLVPLLQVNQITPQSTPLLYSAWQKVRDLAEVLFILVFFIIIIATMLQQDIGMFSQYSIRKMLPKLVIATILVQFSFIFSGMIVDIGNVLGIGVDALFNSITGSASGTSSYVNVLSNLGAMTAGLGIAGGAALVLASWTAAMPLLLGLLLSILAVFFTLGARYLVIAVLVIISPLAFVAWVLPNTEKMFHDWHKLFFRLVLMYPMVVGILTLAGNISQLVGGNGQVGTSDSAAGNVALAFLKPLVIIAAFCVIPVTFKLAGRTLHNAYSILNNGAKIGKSKLQNSEMAEKGRTVRQDRKNKLMSNVLSSNAITSLNAKGKVGRAAGGMMSSTAALALMNAPKNNEQLQRSNSHLNAMMRKQIEELDEGKNPIALQAALKAYAGRTAADRAEGRARVQELGPNLLKYAGTTSGRHAMVELLRDSKFLDDNDLNQFAETDQSRSMIRASRGNMQGEYRALVGAVQSERKSMPGIVLRNTQAADNVKITDLSGNIIDTTNLNATVLRERNIRLNQKERAIGSVNVTAVGTSTAKLTANDLATKFTVDNTKVLQRAAKPGATQHQIQAAYDSALGMAMGFDSEVLKQGFNANNRNAVNANVRMNMYEGVRATREVWAMAEYRSKRDAMLTHLAQDETVTYQLAQKAGMEKSKVDSLSATARAEVARRYITNGWTYNAGRDSDIDWEREAANRTKPFSGGAQPPGGMPNPGKLS